MGKLRSMLVLVAALTLMLGACGDTDSPEPGGAGGDGAGGGGVGGAGGFEEPTGDPQVEGFKPDKAGPAFRIRVLGKNLSPVAPKNSLFFVNSEGSQTPNLEAKGVAADSGGTWFEVDVPFEAKTGPTKIAVDAADGRYSVEGPVFTVTDDRLTPVLGALHPPLITAEERSFKISSQGNGFYKDSTTLYVNDVEHPIDWAETSFTRLVFTVPPEMANTPGTYVVQARTPSPMGELKSMAQSLRVVHPINLLEANLIGARALRLTFDREVGQPDRSYFRIAGFSRRQNYGVRRADRVFNNRNQLDLELTFEAEAGKTYTLTVQPDFTSLEGGAIVEREATFVGKEF